MRIGELCKRANVSKELVRHYESLGLIYSSEMAAGSRYYRQFNDETLVRLSLISVGKKIGLTLREIKPLLDAYLGEELSKKEIVFTLKEQHEKLSVKIKEIKEIQELIEYKIALIT